MTSLTGEEAVIDLQSNGRLCSHVRFGKLATTLS